MLYRWSLRYLYEQVIPAGPALDTFLDEVVTERWHFQHDLGRPFAETSAELTARFPAHADLIALLGPRFGETNPGPVEGMPELVRELDEAGVPLYALTNFSNEFWPAFRARESMMFDRFRGIVVSGDEQLVKPDPAIYRLALERFGLAAKRTLFVDDSPANVAGAAAVDLIALPFTDAATLRAEMVGLGLLTD